MYTALLRLMIRVALVVVLPLLVAGCGDGGGKAAPVPMTTVAGTAVIQGPLAGAQVEIFQLLSDGRRGDLLGTGVTGDDGRYNVQIPTASVSSPLLIRVSGQSGAGYTSTAQGVEVPYGSAESLHVVIENGIMSNVAVTPLTEAAYQKLQQTLTTNLANNTSNPIEGLILASNNWVSSLFFGPGNDSILTDPIGPPGSLDYQAALLVIDQMFADAVASGGTNSTLGVMNIINQALENPDPTAPAYQIYVQALTTAETQVLADNAGDANLVKAIQDLLARIESPAAEPDPSDNMAPSAPTSLSATTFALNATSSSVVLMWSPSTDNIGVIGYEVFRDGVKIATVSSPGYTDPLVTSTVTYSYTVQAFDAIGNRSDPSSPLLVTANQVSLGVTVNGQLSDEVLGLPQSQDLVAPSAPSNLTASTSALSATQSMVLLAWSPATDNTGVTGYEVYRNGGKIATVSLLGYTDTPVISSDTYTYFVMAIDAAGNRSVASNQLLVTPGQTSLGVTVGGQLSGDILGQPQNDIEAPSAPASLFASTSAVTATQSSVLLSWVAATDNVAVTGYDVYRNGSKIATVSVLGYLDPSVNSGTSYLYTVIAFDAAGNRSVASSALTVMLSAAPLGVTFSGQLDSTIIGY